MSDTCQILGPNKFKENQGFSGKKSPQNQTEKDHLERGKITKRRGMTSLFSRRKNAR
jgi:hypothetical protein